MKWCDPTDKSDPVISPQAEIGGFLRKHGSLVLLLGGEGIGV